MSLSPSPALYCARAGATSGKAILAITATSNTLIDRMPTAWITGSVLTAAKANAQINAMLIVSTTSSVLVESVARLTAPH